MKTTILFIGLLLFGCCPECEEETKLCTVERTFDIIFTNDADCNIGVALGMSWKYQNPIQMFILGVDESKSFTFVTGSLVVLAAADSLWDYDAVSIKGPVMHYEVTEYYPCEEIDYHITDPLNQ